MRLKMFGLLGLVVCASAFAMSSVASGAEMTLPGFLAEVPKSATSASKEGKLGLSGGEIACKQATGAYGFNSGVDNLGPMTLDFDGCTLGGETCASLGDTGSLILITGEWHLVLKLVTTTDNRLFLLLVNDTHIECKFLASLLLVKGSILGGPVKAKAGSKTEFEVPFNVPSAGHQEWTLFENNKAENVAAELEANIDEGAFAKTTDSSPTNTLTTSVATELMN
jgi:hypothetical protein